MTCPNCGAVSTNLDKCEYCGSILIKIASVLVSSSDDVKEEMKSLGFGETSDISSNIMYAVEKNITNRLKYDDTEISSFLYPDYGVQISLVSSSKSYSKLRLDLSEDKMNCFRDSKISKLFDTDGGYYVTMMIDNDVKTIAQLINYIVTRVFEGTDEALSFKNYVHINGVFYEVCIKDGKEVYDKVFKNWFESLLEEMSLEMKINAVIAIIFTLVLIILFCVKN